MHRPPQPSMGLRPGLHPGLQGPPQMPMPQGPTAAHRELKRLPLPRTTPSTSSSPRLPIR